VIIVGGKLLLRDYKWLVIGILIPYFAFTSGFVFEITKQEDISRINIPYSIALSNNRVDIVGYYTENDITVMNWAADKGIEPVYVDINGMLLLSERKDPFTWRTKWRYPPIDRSEWNGYFFLRERNNETQELTYKPNYLNPGESCTGMRINYSYNSFNLHGKVIYKVGNATVLEVNNN